MQTTIIIATVVMAFALLRLAMAVHLLAQTQLQPQQSEVGRKLKLVVDNVKEN